MDASCIHPVFPRYPLRESCFNSSVNEEKLRHASDSANYMHIDNFFTNHDCYKTVKIHFITRDIFKVFTEGDQDIHGDFEFDVKISDNFMHRPAQQ